MRIDKCPICQGKLKVKKVVCTACNSQIESEVFTSPILNLPSDQQEFIEMFVLSGGSLKEMSQRLNISYPTVRAKLDDVIEMLKSELSNREAYKKEILDKVERMEMPPEQAAALIRKI